jgi:hypothetical protein
MVAVGVTNVSVGVAVSTFAEKNCSFRSNIFWDVTDHTASHPRRNYSS